MPGNYDANITIGAQIDTSEAEKTAGRLPGALGDALDKGASRVSGASGAMQLALNAVSVAAGTMLTRVADAAGQAVASVVSTGLTFNRQMENYQLAFANLLGSAEAAAAALDAIKADAASTPFDVAGLVSANRLLISTGQSAEEARQVILALGNAVSASGGGNDELQRMAANLQQIANVGEAAAIDIKQFAYAGIDIYGILADYTGQTREEVQELTISYDLLAAALKAASAEGGRYAGAMEAYSQTLQGQMDTLADNATQALGRVTEGVHNALIPIVGDLSATLDAFTASVDWDAWSRKVQSAVTGAYSVIKTLIDFLLQNGQEVISLITGVASAFATWKIISSVTAAVGTLTAAIASAGGLTAALGAVVAAINPVTAVLSALAGAFGVAYSESEVFRDTVNAAVKGMYDYCSGLLASLTGTVANLWSSITTGTNPNDVRNDPEWLAAQAKNGNTQAAGQLQKVQRRSQAAALQSQADADRDVDWAAVEEYNARKAADAATGYAAALDTAAASSGKAAKQVETLADKLDDAHSALAASQAAYKTLSAAVEEYNETGAISLATWQDLMGLAPAYQALLTQEGGKLKLNQAAYNDLTAAQRLEIETLAQANGVLPQTIRLIDSLGIAAEEAAGDTGAAFEAIRSALADATDALDTRARIAALEYELWAETIGATADEADALQAELGSLTAQQELQAQVVQKVEQAYADVCAAYGSASDEAAQMQQTLLEEKLAYAELQVEIQATTDALDAGRDALAGYWDAARESLDAAAGVSNAITDLGNAVIGIEELGEDGIFGSLYDEAEAAGAQMGELAAQYAAAQAEVDSLTRAYNDSLTSTGAASVQTLTLAYQLLTAQNQAAALRSQMDALSGPSFGQFILAAGQSLGSVFSLIDGFAGLMQSCMNLGQMVLPTIAQAVIGLCGSVDALVPGLNLASAATGTFNAVLNANPIVLVITLIGMLVMALLGLGSVYGSVSQQMMRAQQQAYQQQMAQQQAQKRAEEAQKQQEELQKQAEAAQKEQEALQAQLQVDALEDNTAALEEQNDLLRNPPRYQSGGGGPLGAVVDYAAMLAAAQRTILAQGTRLASNYDVAGAATAARLHASWQGSSTTVLQVDGREVARATAPYMDEELAFLT